MKKTFTFFEILLLMCGVFYAETEEVKSVMEGDSVTLNPDLTQIQGIIQILWRFGEPGLTIARFKNGISYDEKFKDRLQLNKTTGFLTIRNMRTNHSGLYKVQVDHDTGTSDQRFSVTVYESPSVIAGTEAELKSVSVTAGDPVTLHVPQIQGDELIVWRFGDEGKLIAKADIETKSSPLYYETDERFRDRLKLDQTGSLIITNTRTTDSGEYKVKISSNKQTLYKRFTVTVTVPVPDPGFSGGAVAGIVIGVLLLLTAAVAGVMYFYRRPITTNLPNQTWLVPPFDNITLNPEPEIQRGDEIQWLFGAEEILIAEIKGENREMKTYDCSDGIFKNRLKQGETTGSLTITNTRTEHSGLYTLKIRRGRETFYKRFIVSVGERKMTVTEGEPVTLKPDIEINKDETILWMFEDEKELYSIAEFIGEIDKFLPRDYTPGRRFRDRLELNKTTGSLTIKNTRTTDAGHYMLQVFSNTEFSQQTFTVTVDDESEKKFVDEGDSVTLKPDTEIQSVDQILWMFGDQDKLIAQIRGGTVETYDDVNKIFRDRLKLDKTGSLTITEIEAEHTGLYKLLISSSRGTFVKKFKVLLDYESKKKFVDEGDSVTLKPDTEIQTDDQILWMFGDLDKLIAQIKGGTVETYDDVNERFRDKLKLDEKTGSLTITEIEAEHTGLYKLQIISSSRGTFVKKFKVLLDLSYVLEGKGETVYFDSGTNEIQTDEEVKWRFGDEMSLIAEIKEGTGKTYDGPDEIFRGRLELNKKTGGLTINDSTYEHTGEYKVTISSSKGVRNRTHVFTVRGSKILIEKKREKSLMKAKIDSRRNRVNESVTVVNPLLNGDDLDVVNEEEGTSSL
ncbi:uncharacterized protein LOC127988465 isoform X1 [Carassius gibelio]|uniref:uncharacterized protein LOC127988465 isoform X1 n=1 Tax=Carassius gibelio TaxID=101364 RepID=UPI002278E0EE|nr:uncharacterized protein LOC127988465 isoform X1 [Carassius gibelio]